MGQIMDKNFKFDLPYTVFRRVKSGISRVNHSTKEERYKLRKPKFELICKGDGGNMQAFTLKNVSSVIASNIHAESFDLIYHDGERQNLLTAETKLPTSLGPNEIKEFSCSHPALQHRGVGYNTIQLAFTVEDELSNQYKCVAIKNVEEERKYLLGTWDVTVQAFTTGGDELGAMTKPTVFISYNWGSESSADEVESRLKPIATVLRDKSSIKPWGSITEFMKRIRETDLVVVIVSEKYLKSVNSMYEVMQLLKDDCWKAHSMFLVEESATGIYKAIGQLEYIKYWNDEANNLEVALKELSPAQVTNQAEELRKIKLIQLNINEFLKSVADSNNPELCRAIDAVIDRVKGTREPETEDHIEPADAKHIVEIKAKIEAAIVDKTRVRTQEDRLKHLRNRPSQFKCNNLILKDPTIPNPDFNNGLIKAEPYDFSDDGIVVVPMSGDMRKKVKVKGRGEIEVDVFSEVLFRDIEEIDPHGSQNYPYPTLFCRFYGKNPFNRDVYYDVAMGHLIDENQIEV